MQNKADKSQELQWLKEAQQDPAAFEQIFDAFHQPIFNYILRRTSDVSLSHDLTANTFFKALNNIKKFEWKGISLSAWLYRIATNEINLNYRGRRKFVRLTPAVTDTLKDDLRTDADLLQIEESVQQHKQFQLARAAINKLKIKYQNVLSLRYFEDKSIKEIAEILNLPENTIKTHIRRGLSELRKKL